MGDRLAIVNLDDSHSPDVAKGFVYSVLASPAEFSSLSFYIYYSLTCFTLDSVLVLR